MSSRTGGGDTFLEESQFSEIDGHYIKVDRQDFLFFKCVLSPF